MRPMRLGRRLGVVWVAVLCGSLLSMGAEPIGMATGIVTDEQGKALEGVTVQICASENFLDGTWQMDGRSGVMSRYSTDKDGRFAVPFHEADIRHSVWFYKLGFAPTFLNAVSPEGDELKVELERGIKVGGFVSRLVGGNLVPARLISVELRRPTGGGWYQQRTLTGLKGRYSFDVAPRAGDEKWSVEVAGESVRLDFNRGSKIGPDFVVVVQVVDRMKTVQQPAGGERQDPPPQP